MYLYTIKIYKSIKESIFCQFRLFPTFWQACIIILAQSVFRQSIWSTRVLDIVWFQSTINVNEARENMVVSKILPRRNRKTICYIIQHLLSTKMSLNASSVMFFEMSCRTVSLILASFGRSRCVDWCDINKMAGLCNRKPASGRSHLYIQQSTQLKKDKDGP